MGVRKYKYKAKKGPLETVEGLVSATSQDDALDKINEMGLFPVDIKEDSSQGYNWTGIQLASPKKTLASREVITFYRHLAKLIKSGVPILRTLALIAEQTENTSMKDILSNIQTSVREGHSFSASLMAYPRIFSSFDIAMLQAGETVGKLDESLVKIVGYREENEKIRSKVRTSLIYPAFIMLAGLGAFGFMLGYVVPQFSRFFEDFGRDLPLITKVLIAFGNFVKDYTLIGIGFCAFAGILIPRLLRGESNKFKFHRFLLKLPKIGNWFVKLEIVRFTRTLSLLLKSGVPVLNAMRISIPVVGNEALKKELKLCYAELEEGRNLSDGLRRSVFFPSFVTHLVSLGEESGRLDEALTEIADWYEQDTVEAVQIFVSLLEPMVILTIGLVLGVMIIAVLLPVFNIDTLVDG